MTDPEVTWQDISYNFSEEQVWEKLMLREKEN